MIFSVLGVVILLDDVAMPKHMFIIVLTASEIISLIAIILFPP